MGVGAGIHTAPLTNFVTRLALDKGAGSETVHVAISVPLNKTVGSQLTLAFLTLISGHHTRMQIFLAT
jgi:hypothetical protein